MSDVVTKYPDRVPVIAATTGDLYLDKNRFLVPRDMTVGQFTMHVRKRLEMKATEALFVLVDKTLPPVSATMDTIYKQHAGNDQFLHLTFCKENVFG